MMIDGQSTPDRPIFIVSVPLSIMIIYRRFISLSMNFRRFTGLLGPPNTGVLSIYQFQIFQLPINSNLSISIFQHSLNSPNPLQFKIPMQCMNSQFQDNYHLNSKLQKMYEDDEGSQDNQSENRSQMNQSQNSRSQQPRHSEQEKSMSSNRSSRKQSEQSSEFQDREMQVRKWQWAYPIIEGVSPCQRGGHSATLSGASIVIFGGHYYTGKNEGYAYLNDTYVLDVNANKFTKPKISGTPPAPRYAHSAVLAGSKIIIFGGRGDKSKVFRDLHALDPVSMTWLQGPEGIGSPSARYGHTAVLVAETKIFIFGGTNGKEYYNDLYVLDLEVMAWSQPKCQGPLPSPRQGHTAIQVGTNMIIQGGFNFDEQAQRNAGFRQGTQLQSCYLNDIRILDTDKYEWARVRVSGTPPLPRYGHTANISGPDIIFFGGWSINSGARGEQNFIPPADIDYFIVLNTDNQLVWEKGKFEGQPPLSRYGHTATSIGPHILIFGGWQFNRAASEVVVLRDMTAASKKK